MLGLHGGGSWREICRASAPRGLNGVAATWAEDAGEGDVGLLLGVGTRGRRGALER